MNMDENQINAHYHEHDHGHVHGHSQWDAASAAAKLDRSASGAGSSMATWLPSAVDPPGSMAWSLASRPEAERKIHLHFLGANVTGTKWNAVYGDVIVIPPYDTDGDASSFSSSELSDVVSIWRTVAEHYAVFDVDVTTVPPSGTSLAPNMSQSVIIGGSGKWCVCA
jgi:hypothetical protein